MFLILSFTPFPVQMLKGIICQCIRKSGNISSKAAACIENLCNVLLSAFYVALFDAVLPSKYTAGKILDDKQKGAHNY